jgi:hypothetical protein
LHFIGIRQLFSADSVSLPYFIGLLSFDLDVDAVDVEELPLGGNFTHLL